MKLTSKELKLLWKLAIDLSNSINNFAEIKLKNWKQSDFKNLNTNKERGFCGLVSAMTSFEKELNLNNVNKLNHLTKLDISIRNDAKLLTDYFNGINKNKDWKLIYENSNIDNNIKYSIENGKSCIFTFYDHVFNNGHGVSIWKYTKNTIGFIENGDNIVLFYVMLVYLYKNNPMIIDNEIIDLNTIYDLTSIKKILPKLINRLVISKNDNVIEINKKVFYSAFYNSNPGLIYIKDNFDNFSIFDRLNMNYRYPKYNKTVFN